MSFGIFVYSDRIKLYSRKKFKLRLFGVVTYYRSVMTRTWKIIEQKIPSDACRTCSYDRSVTVKLNLGIGAESYIYIFYIFFVLIFFKNSATVYSPVLFSAIALKDEF